MTVPQQNGSSTSTSVPLARSFPWLAYLLVALLSLAVLGGGLLLLWDAGRQGDLGTVTEVRLTARPGIDLTKLGEVWRTPDLYIEVWTDLGHVRTKTIEDAKIGNGLTFPLPVPVRLADIREVKVFDEGMVSNALKDRVDRPGRETEGERFHFALGGEVPPPSGLRTVGLGLTVAGAALLLLTLIVLVRAQVV